jgi:hypothetical protein
MFGRKKSPGRAAETLLVVAQNALQFRSPDWFGEGAYYVRVFRPSSGDRPSVIITDTGNHPVASATNRFDEIAVLVADRVFGIPGVAPADLTSVARWLENTPAGLHGPNFGETYNEVWFEGGGSFPRMRHRYLRHAEVEELIGERVEPLPAAKCAPASLRRRGVQEIRVAG